MGTRRHVDHLRQDPTATEEPVWVRLDQNTDPASVDIKNTDIQPTDVKRFFYVHYYYYFLYEKHVLKGNDSVQSATWRTGHAND
jgi:hypothetical protein